MKKVLARQTWPIGQQVLWEEDGQLFIAIRNRTYRQKMELPYRHKERWMRYFRGEGA